MTSLFYEDLLTVNYKPHGRSLKDGLDCYGFVIECCKRTGQTLKDVTYLEHIKEKDVCNYVTKVNVKKIGHPNKNCVAECETEDGGLHIVFCIDKKTVIHMTRQGVRITPLVAFKNCTYYEVV